MTTKILMATVLFILSSFACAQKDNLIEISGLSIDSMGDLKWTVHYTEDQQGLLVKIEHFKNNRWVYSSESGYMTCATLSAPKRPEPYKTFRRDSARVRFHKGVNRYRISAKAADGVTTAEVQLISRMANNDGSLWIINNTIILDQKEYYEIIGHNGTTISKGEGREIDISALQKGAYFFYTKKATWPFTR